MSSLMITFNVRNSEQRLHPAKVTETHQRQVHARKYGDRKHAAIIRCGFGNETHVKLLTFYHPIWYWA